ncbi:MAG: imidazole glycerol phosphate synthase subunit HisF [Candidatus Pacebacteria bacterium]|nr:imidazole glycerol phosphate synthase subunit HisF [Candidatus Paceibacterota bacterium]MBP9842562.1 imidazole glycerol phosphate synthase subunit HisF [Candidatus Paceibacterota bacterium]
MLRPRLIPVLLYKDGILVRSKSFNFHQSTGDPIEQVIRFTEWKSDELIYLDISRANLYNSELSMSTVGSTSSKKEHEAYHLEDFESVIKAIAKQCNIPLTVGGKIRTLEDVHIRLKNGADKVSINTMAFERPEFITEVAEKFGRQCVVASVDVKFDSIAEKHEVYVSNGKVATGLDPVAWCRKLEKLGAGEILLQSIDRDGGAKGYDIYLIKEITKAVSIPVICLGGVGTYQHLVEGLENGASAVAAANIFHFTEQSVIKAKEYLFSVGINVRL